MAGKNDKNNTPDRDRLVQKRLELLKEEYAKLHEQKIATDRDLANLDKQLKELRKKAEEEYGTSDVEQLQALLEKRRQENERMVDGYQKHGDGIKEQLLEIEKGEVKEN